MPGYLETVFWWSAVVLTGVAFWLIAWAAVRTLHKVFKND